MKNNSSVNEALNILETLVKNRVYLSTEPLLKSTLRDNLDRAEALLKKIRGEK